VKFFNSAAITINGIELMYRLRKGQFAPSKLRTSGKTAPEIWSAALGPLTPMNAKAQSRGHS
jgi:hypothetical protein